MAQAMQEFGAREYEAPVKKQGTLAAVKQAALLAAVSVMKPVMP